MIPADPQTALLCFLTGTVIGVVLGVRLERWRVVHVPLWPPQDEALG